MIKLSENKIGVVQYLLYSMTLYMKSWWWAYVLPLALCLALSVWNVNFLFVAVILLFLVFTMILFFVVIYYGLVEESRYSTQSKEVVFDENGVELHLKRVKTTTDDEHNEHTEREQTLTVEDEFVLLDWDRFKCVKGNDDCLLLLFKNPKYSLFALPYEVFESEDDLRNALSFIRSHI